MIPVSGVKIHKFFVKANFNNYRLSKFTGLISANYNITGTFNSQFSILNFQFPNPYLCTLL